MYIDYGGIRCARPIRIYVEFIIRPFSSAFTNKLEFSRAFISTVLCIYIYIYVCLRRPEKMSPTGYGREQYTANNENNGVGGYVFIFGRPTYSVLSTTNFGRTTTFGKDLVTDSRLCLRPGTSPPPYCRYVVETRHADGACGPGNEYRRRRIAIERATNFSGKRTTANGNRRLLIAVPRSSPKSGNSARINRVNGAVVVVLRYCCLISNQYRHVDIPDNII